MEDNKFRQLIKSGRFAMGLNIHSEDPAMVRLATDAGFDFILPTIHKRTAKMVRAAVAAQIPHLVRMVDPDPANPDPSLIGKALDLGADGLQFMLVSSRQQAENIVRLCRRANEPVIAIKIETKEGLEHAEEIVSVPGIDMICSGPGDLSKSLGVRQDSPVVVEARQHIIKLAKSAGVAVEISVMSAEDLGEWVKREKSLRFFQLAIDVTEIGRAFRGLIQRNKELVA